jgi:hypothetical protein
MRLIKTFLLRLYTDPGQGEKICGDLRILPGRKSLPFKNHSELIILLQRYSNEEVKNIPEIVPEDANDTNFVQRNSE